MLLLLIPLFIASIFSLLGGAAWLLLSSSQIERRNGPEVGGDDTAEIMQGAEDESDVERTAFEGDSETLNAKASFSFREIKQEMRAGRRNTAAPLLMAVGGFLGVLLFGSLALLVAIDDKLLGAIITTISVITVIRILVAMIRA